MELSILTQLALDMEFIRYLLNISVYFFWAENSTYFLSRIHFIHGKSFFVSTFPGNARRCLDAGK